MRFVELPAGRFTRGSPSDETGREAQEVPHEVTLTRRFAIGKYEVTQAEWAAVMGTHPSHFDDPSGRRPVEGVNWFDVQVFLERLSARSGHHFRLPTEAEWEFACRSGTTHAYATGASLGVRDANIDVEAGTAATTAAARGRTTLPVGSFAPNAWGVHDMHGNVWEWTSDRHCPYPASAVSDPASSCASAFMVIRGGSWYFGPDSARCALRYTHRPQDSGFSLGFRVVRDLEPPR